MSQEDNPRRVGYVRGDKGKDGREVLLRIDNDANLGPEESGTGTHLQWKYAGEEFKRWTNLIQINELFNIALAGLQLEYTEVIKTIGGNPVKHDRLYLASYKTVYTPSGDLVLTDKIANISYVDVPVRVGSISSVTFVDGNLIFIFQDGTVITVPIAFEGLEEAPKDGNTYGRKDGEWVLIECKGGNDFIELDLSDQIDSIINTFVIPSEVTDETAVSVYYNGQRLFKNHHYTIDTGALILTFVPELPKDEL